MNSKGTIKSFLVLFSLVLVILLSIPYITSFGFGVQSANAAETTAACPGKCQAPVVGAANYGYYKEKTGSTKYCANNNELCFITASSITGCDTCIGSGNYRNWCKYSDTIGYCMDIEGVSPPINCLGGYSIVTKKTDCPGQTQVTINQQTTTTTKLPTDTECQFCMKRKAAGEKVVFCSKVRVGALAQYDISPGVCNPETTGCGSSSYSYFEQINDINNCPKPECSSLCVNAMFYSGLSSATGSSQQISMPIGQCSNGPPMAVLGNIYGQQSASSFSLLSTQPAGYGADGGCDPGQQCWCLRLNAAQLSQNTAATNYPSATIPGRAATARWKNPREIKNPPRSGTDTPNGVPSNATIGAKIDYKLVQAGQTLTITGNVEKKCSTCDGWTYKCEAYKEYECKVSEGFAPFGKPWKIYYEYDNCPADLSEQLGGIGAKTVTNTKQMVNDIITAYALYESATSLFNKDKSDDACALMLSSVASMGSSASIGGVNVAQLIQMIYMANAFSSSQKTTSTPTAKVVENPFFSATGMVTETSVDGYDCKPVDEEKFVCKPGDIHAYACRAGMWVQLLGKYSNYDDCKTNCIAVGQQCVYNKKIIDGTLCSQTYIDYYICNSDPADINMYKCDGATWNVFRNYKGYNSNYQQCVDDCKVVLGDHCIHKLLETTGTGGKTTTPVTSGIKLTASQIAAAQAQAAGKNDNSGCDALKGTCKQIVQGLTNTNGYFIRGLCKADSSASVQCFISDSDMKECTDCTTAFAKTWCHDKNNIASGYCSDSSTCEFGYTPGISCGTTIQGGASAYYICEDEAKNLYCTDTCLEENVRYQYSTMQECQNNLEKMPSQILAALTEKCKSCQSGKKKWCMDPNTLEEYCDTTCKDSFEISDCDMTSTSSSDKKATCADTMKLIMMAKLVAGMLKEPDANVCYSVCGEKYETDAGRAPVCAKGLGGTGAAEVPTGYNNATYTCHEMPCGNWADRKVKIEITGPEGNNVKTDYTKTDSNGAFSFTFTAPAADGEFTAVISIPKE